MAVETISASDGPWESGQKAAGAATAGSTTAINQSMTSIDSLLLLRNQKSNSTSNNGNSSISSSYAQFYGDTGPSSMNELLQKSAWTICQRYSIAFAQFSQIQKKFLTHYRCHACGLQPLYYLNLSHPKRARCRSCGQVVAFKTKGKYGKFRKEIAFELFRAVAYDKGQV